MNLPETISEDLDLENIQPTSIDKTKASLIIPISRALQERRAYAYIEVLLAVSTDAYEVKASVEFLRNNVPVAKFPASFSGNAGTNAFKSIASMVNSGGSPVGDSRVLRLATPFDALFPAVVLQAMRVNCDAEKCVLRIEKISPLVTGIRTYLACVSTKYL